MKCEIYYGFNFDEKLKENSENTFKFCDGDLNKFELLLFQDGVYLYKYIDSWTKFSETLFHSKGNFSSNLNLEHFSNPDYKYF